MSDRDLQRLKRSLELGEEIPTEALVLIALRNERPGFLYEIRDHLNRAILGRMVDYETLHRIGLLSDRLHTLFTVENFFSSRRENNALETLNVLSNEDDPIIIHRLEEYLGPGFENYDSVRLGALRNMQKFHEPSCGPIMAQIATRDRDPYVQAEAIRSLGDLRDPNLTPIIARFLEDTNPNNFLRNVAIYSLDYIDPDDPAVQRLINILYHGFYRDSWEAAARSLAKIGGDTAMNAVENAMMMRLGSRNQYTHGRSVFFSILYAYGRRESIPYLEKVIETHDEDARSGARYALRGIRERLGL